MGLGNGYIDVFSQDTKARRRFRLDCPSLYPPHKNVLDAMSVLGIFLALIVRIIFNLKPSNFFS